MSDAGVMCALFFGLGVVITAPVFFALGRFARIDSSIRHERADIRPALRKSSGR